MPGSVIELDALPLAVLVLDAAGTVHRANARAAALFGVAPTGAQVGALFPDQPTAHRDLIAAAADDVRVSVHGRRANGVPFTAYAKVGAGSDGELVCTLREVGGEELVEEAARWFHAAFDNAPIGMALFNTDGEYVRVNDTLCRMLGRSRCDLLGRRDQELTHPDDRQADVDAAWRILNGEIDHHQTEKRFLAPCGGVVWTIANLTFVRDERGRPLAWLGQFQDISDRKDAELQLRRIADHDDLTGIPNRRRLVEELSTRLLLAGRHGERGAVLVLDLDGFKAINDTKGHGAGDEILHTVAQALRARLRATDLLARLGGDEFAVVLPHAAADEAMAVADALNGAVRAACEGAVTASCGVALYGPDGPGSPEHLLAEADRAMYHAKQSGRDGAALWGVTPAGGS
jgi:diguanylate cyclase (GGDEF)-like protein/PAS domain S-box-containing protein